MPATRKGLNKEGGIFVVGASRSGTAMLRSSLNQHPDIFVSGETHYFDDLRVRFRTVAPSDGADWAECLDYFRRLRHRPYGHQGEAEESDITRAELEEKALEYGGGLDDLFRAYCGICAEREGATMWGEKTPRHAFRIREIFSAFPGAKVIFMIRDPRSVVSSYKHWRNMGGFDLDADPGHQDALVAEERRTKASYDPVISSFLWRSGANAAFKARDGYGEDRVLIVKYEDLVDSPSDVISWISEWVGVGYSDDLLDVPAHNSSFVQYQAKGGIHRKSVSRWREKLDPYEIAIVETMCRSEMIRSGYESGRVDYSILRVLLHILELPWSVVRAWWANRARVGNPIRYCMSRVVSFARS